MMEWSVVNSTVCGSFPHPIDLSRLRAKLEPPAIYDSRKFSGLVWKRGKGMGCSLIFASGKFTIVGLTETQHILQIISEMTEAVGLAPTSYELKNIVVSADFKHRYNLHKLCYQLQTRGYNASFDPHDLMPPLMLKYKGKTVLIHHTGKLIITGLRRYRKIDKFLTKVYDIVTHHDICYT